MGRQAQSEFLLKFVEELKARNALPKHIELSRLGPVHIASIFDELQSEVITESIFTGMDVNPYVAVLKGLVEMIERRAFSAGWRAGLASCQTERSDGFAAFPLGIVNDTSKAAQRNARYEAIERFVWASWWDDQRVGHRAEAVTLNEGSVSAGLLTELKSLVPIANIYRVVPRIANEGGAVVAIYFAFLEPHGVVSGGACGPAADLESINFRALCELSRHALAVRKIREGHGKPVTFYEQRLAYFGLNEIGAAAVKERIERIGPEGVTLPELEIDERVPHSLSDLVLVHRCYFKNQPPFVGGRLERLCL